MLLPLLSLGNLPRVLVANLTQARKGTLLYWVTLGQDILDEPFYSVHYIFVDHSHPHAENVKSLFCNKKNRGGGVG